ncbi:hypothetical protein ACIFOT_27480 [Neobacillus sp. NRS-1170]|uniref:hypothetical protein n=1 Tax=Neobacillus sp. NRS-1170 TaxID=3233898 RepID=UPI003D266233
MKKVIVSLLAAIFLSFILGNTFPEAKTRSGGTSRSGSSVSKPSISAPPSSPTKQTSSSSTKNTTTNPPSYSSLTTKYPKATRYFSGDVLSKTLLFGSTVLLLNDSYDDEPTYEDEQGNVYTLADLEGMDVQIPDEEPVQDSNSETVTFNEDQPNTGATEVIETASSNEDYTSFDDDTYEEENNPSFNWLWLILPLAAIVIIRSYLRRMKK